jgi:hypothetical protein
VSFGRTFHFVFLSIAVAIFACGNAVPSFALEAGPETPNSVSTSGSASTLNSPPNSSATAVELPKEKKYTFALTTAVAFPQPLTLGIQVHKTDTPDFDAFYEAGFFKYPLTNATRSFSDYSIDAGVRWHPFHNWFYTSAALGYRQIGISVDISNLKQDGLALANSATLSIGTFFLGLLVGGEWKLTSNVSFAFDLGIQLALLHTGGIEIHADPAQDSDPNDLTVDDNKELRRISGLPLPQIAILRFIWYI